MKLLIALVCVWPAAQPQQPTKPAGSGIVTLTEEAKRIHAEAIVIDGHNDLPWKMREQADWTTQLAPFTQSRLQWPR